MIVGIVLAAGRSRRMGRPKAFLEIGTETFLERAIASLSGGGCDPVVVVTGPAELPEPALIARLARASGARTCSNPEPRSEQIDSLRAALRELPDGVLAAVVLPVDVPVSGPSAVSSVIGRFRDSAGSLIVPTFDGRRGHPILIAARLFPEILQEDLPEGVRSLIRSHESDLGEVPVDDPAVLLDVDTPWDYTEHLDRKT
jgi:molybdenum cofactor cytidylyltransferase